MVRNTLGAPMHSDTFYQELLGIGEEIWTTEKTLAMGLGFAYFHIFRARRYGIRMTTRGEGPHKAA